MSTETSKFQIETGVDPSGIQDGMQAVEQAVIKTERTVTDSSARMGKAIGATGDQASKGADKADKSLGNLTASIQRYNAQLESGGQKGAKYFESLADSRGLDKTNEAFQTAIAKTRQLESENQKLSISAKQTAAAMRGVPAQFTDIVTSLQGGQAPMTVLLQQGGQLKDMFGGAGNAAKALGGYVMGLVNPLTVTAAGAATLAYALYAGSVEASEFAKTLLVTGNQAGVTSGQLMAMAAAVSAVSGTQGNAADVLNQLAATGKVTSANLQQAAQAAVQFEKAGGQAAGETVKAFAELGKAPLEASLKLNESMGYLTKSTYAQIKALMDQGRETEAASVAQKAFADALGSRSGEMVKNLGLVEKSWAGIKGAVTGAWDAIKSIGRETGVEGQTAATSQAIKSLSKQIELRGSYDASTPYGRETIAMGEQLRLLKEKHELLQSDERLLRNAAEQQAQQTRAVEAQAKLDKDGITLLDKKAKAEREIKEFRGLAITAGWTEVQIAERIAAIREKYKETGTGQDAGEAALAKQKATLEEAKQYAINLQRELAAVMAGDTSGFAKQTQAEKTAIELQAQLATGIKGVARANMEKQLAVALDTVEVEKSNRVTEKQIQIQKDLEKQRTAELKALGAEAVAIQAKADALNAELGVRGKSKAAIEEGVLARLKENAADAAMFDNSGDLVAAINAKIVAQEALVKAMKATDYDAFNQHTDELLRSAQEQQKLYQDELQLSGLTAVERAKIVAQRAIELKYAKELDALDKSSLSDDQKETQRLKLHEAKRTESAAATGKVIQAEYDRVSQQIEQSLTDALMRGFESGKGFAQNLRDTVVNIFKTLVLRPVVSAVVNPVAQTITGGLVHSGAANAAGGAGLYGGFAASGLGEALGLSTSLDGLGMGMSGSVLTGLGSTIAAALPYLGAALSVVSLIKSLDHSGTIHTGGAGTYSAATGAQSSDATAQGFAKININVEAQNAAKSIAEAIGKTLDSVAGTFGKTAGYSIATAFADDTSKDGAWGSLVIKKAGEKVLDWNDTRTSRWAPKEFADGEEGRKQYLLAVAKDVRDTLMAETPKWADDMLAALGDAPSIEQLGGTVEQINAVQTALVAMGNVSAQFVGLSEDATAALITAMGGAQNAVAGLQSYYGNFYSEQERAAVVAAQVTDAMAKLGLQMPTTRDGFRALVDAQDLTTDAGRNTYAALIALSPAFASVTEAAVSSASRVASITGDITKALQGVQQTASQSAQSTRSAALSNLSAAISREKALWQQQVDAAAGLASEVRSIFDTLGSSISQLRAEATGGTQSAAQGQAFISAALDAARASGSLPDQKDLADAIAAATSGLAASQFSSDAERQFAQLKLAGELEALQGISGDQLTAAQFAQKTADEQLKALDRQLAYWQQQIDGTASGVNATLSVADAIRAMQVAMQSSLDTGFSGISGLGQQTLTDQLAKVATQFSPGTTSSAVQQLSSSIAGGTINLNDAVSFLAGTPSTSKLFHDQVEVFKNFDSAGYYAEIRKNIDVLINQGMSGQALSQTLIDMGVSLTDASKAYGVTAAEIAANLLRAGATKLPQLAVGTNYVPNDMLAVIHQGEAVVPKAYNPWANGAGTGMGNTLQLERLVQGLTAEVQRLQALVGEGNRYARDTSQTLDQVTAGGAAMRTELA